MAIRINSGRTLVKRKDVHLIDPNEVIADPKLNGRRVDGEYARRSIIRLADKIEKDGQLQPCLGRRDEDKRITIKAGFRRYKAVLLINEKRKSSGEPFLPLQVIISDSNDEDAFKVNIQENLERENTTPMDDADNMKRLTDRFGMSVSEVADFYHCTEQTVNNHLSLLKLPSQIQDAISDMIIGISTGLDLLKLPGSEMLIRFEENVQSALEELQVSDIGQIVSDGSAAGERTLRTAKRKIAAKVKEGVTNSKKAQGKSSPSLSMKNVRKFFTGMIEDEDVEEDLRDHAKKFLDFIGGKITTEQFLVEMKNIKST